MNKPQIKVNNLEDPAIISDLRINNGFNGTKFNIFWDETEA